MFLKRLKLLMKLQIQTTDTIEKKSQKPYLPVRELNPGLPRDRRGY